MVNPVRQEINTGSEVVWFTCDGASAALASVVFCRPEPVGEGVGLCGAGDGARG